jgi:hypothetical protein
MPKENPQTVMLMLACPQRRPCLRLFPTRACSSTLCVTGGRQWLLGDADTPTRAWAPCLALRIHRLAGAGDLATNKLLEAVYIKYKHIYRRTLSVHVNS